MVKLVAIEDNLSDRKPGAWKGKVKIGPDFFRAASSGRTRRLEDKPRCAVCSTLIPSFGG